MIIIAPQPASLVGKSQHHAFCWRLSPVVGPIVRLTSHNHALVATIDGVEETFLPIGSVTRSALRRETGLADLNIAFEGPDSSTAIAVASLRAGIWDDAQVDEYRVDWRFPWSGFITHNRFWVDDAEFNRDRWSSDLSGLARWLRQEAGEVTSKTCGWKRLGFNFGVATRAGCKVDVAALTFTGVSVAAVASKRVFTTDTGVITSGLGADYFTDGIITWLTGDNAGAQSEVSMHAADAAGAYTIELQHNMAFPIQAGDTFSIEPGCDRSAATCKVKFANFDNFNGDDELPDSETVLGVIS